MKIQRIQLKKHSCPYWNKVLEESLNEVKKTNKTASTTGNVEDERKAKNNRNRHSRLLKKTIKHYYREKFKKKNEEYKNLRNITESEDKTPTMIIASGTTFNKPTDIANKMGEYFVNKVETIRNGITSNQFQAMRTYRKLIPSRK